MKQMFDICEQLIVGQSDEIHEVNTINWEDSSWKQFFWSVMKESSVSLASEGLRISRFCVMPWKDAPETTIKYCLGRQVDVVQEFITIQNFGQN